MCVLSEEAEHVAHCKDEQAKAEHSQRAGTRPSSGEFPEQRKGCLGTAKVLLFQLEL